MNFSEYAAIDAVNASTLKELASKSPRHYRYLLDHPRTETDAMRFGTAVHTAILEPDKFASLYIRRPDDCDYRTNAGKAWRDEQQQAGRIILTADEHQRLIDMRDSVMSHPTARAIIEGASVETTITWTDPETGILCKGRCDIVNGNVLADLKTTRDIRPRPFMLTAYQFGYHFSMAFYLDGLRANGIDVDRAILLAVETGAPHDCAPYELDDEWLELGRAEYQEALCTLAECRRTNRWPGMVPDARFLQFPKWAVPTDDDETFETTCEVIE
jgi:hypothetical protein